MNKTVIKICRNCKTKLNSKNWSKSNKKIHSNLCKVCQLKRQQLWIANNKDKYEKYHKDYYKKHKEKYVIQSQRSRLKKQYNLTIENYDKMVKLQNGCCAICGIHKSKLKKKLCVDHNHITNLIGKLLCHRCNSGLSCFKDDISVIAKALSYAEKYHTHS